MQFIFFAAILLLVGLFYLPTNGKSSIFLHRQAVENTTPGNIKIVLKKS